MKVGQILGPNLVPIFISAYRTHIWALQVVLLVISMRWVHLAWLLFTVIYLLYFEYKLRPIMRPVFGTRFRTKFEFKFNPENLNKFQGPKRPVSVWERKNDYYYLRNSAIEIGTDIWTPRQIQYLAWNLGLKCWYLYKLIILWDYNFVNINNYIVELSWVVQNSMY